MSISYESNDVTTAATHDLPTPPLRDSDRASQGQRSQPNSPLDEHNSVLVPACIRSPPPSEEMLADTDMRGLGTDTVCVASSVRTTSMPYTQQNDGGYIPLGLTEHSVPVTDRYSPHNSYFSSGSRDISSIDDWDAADMTEPIAGFEHWLQGSDNGLADIQSFNGNQGMGLEEFDLITMDSMALNNAALDADLSTYAKQHAPGPWNKMQQDCTHDPGRTPIALPVSSSLPIEASALNVEATAPQSLEVLSRMPSLLKETPRRTLASPIIEEDTYYAIMAGAKDCMPISADIDPLLSLQDMQQFMKCYLACFHRHCPVIHLPSLNLRATPGLVFAMCAIGALYRLRRKTAHDLWQCAENLCKKAC